MQETRFNLEISRRHIWEVESSSSPRILLLSI